MNDFNDEVNDAMGGILKYGDDLFVGIAPDLWRIKENKNGSSSFPLEIKLAWEFLYNFFLDFSFWSLAGNIYLNLITAKVLF